MFKIHELKSNHRVLKKNQVDAYGAPFSHLIMMPLPKGLVTRPISEANFSVSWPAYKNKKFLHF
jgi:hypothetical protein